MENLSDLFLYVLAWISGFNVCIIVFWCSGVCSVNNSIRSVTLENK